MQTIIYTFTSVCVTHVTRGLPFAISPVLVSIFRDRSILVSYISHELNISVVKHTSTSFKVLLRHEQKNLTRPFIRHFQRIVPTQNDMANS